MNKAYNRINWENYPSDATPLNEQNLNKMDSAVDEIDNRVIVHETTKATKAEVATLVQDVTFEETTGIITVLKKNGSIIKIDTQMEKIAINFSYNSTTQQIILTLIDGTKQYIDLSALITQYEFLDSDTIAVTIDSTGKVTAIVKEGSIEEKHLQPNYLADVKVEVAKAQKSQTAAALSETNAKTSETNAKTSETNAKTSETNALNSANASAQSETNAKTSETNALNSANASAQSETNAKTSETNALNSANASAQSETNAKTSETNAKLSETNAIQKAIESSRFATEAESWAHGSTNSRLDENIDNARYYYEQTKKISQGINGIIPMGTVSFADLPTVDIQKNAMYNISDEFISDERFNDGGGNWYGAGNNVVWTANEKWDVLASSNVTGIKGDKEEFFRQGNVNLTTDDIGALALDGDSKDNTVTFTNYDISPVASKWDEMSYMTSKESHSSLFSKLSKAVKNLRFLQQNSVKLEQKVQTLQNAVNSKKIDLIGRPYMTDTHTTVTPVKLADYDLFIFQYIYAEKPKTSFVAPSSQLALIRTTDNAINMEWDYKNGTACLIYSDGSSNIIIFHNTQFYPVHIWGIKL